MGIYHTVHTDHLSEVRNQRKIQYCMSGYSIHIGLRHARHIVGRNIIINNTPSTRFPLWMWMTSMLEDVASCKGRTRAFLCIWALGGSLVFVLHRCGCRCWTARMDAFEFQRGWNCPALCSGWHAHIIRTHAHTHTQKHRSHLSQNEYLEVRLLPQRQKLTV